MWGDTMASWHSLTAIVVTSTLSRPPALFSVRHTLTHTASHPSRLREEAAVPTPERGERERESERGTLLFG